ncbi:unnamed protein product [Closterium sp. NIES-53]
MRFTFLTCITPRTQRDPTQPPTDPAPALPFTALPLPFPSLPFPSLPCPSLPSPSLPCPSLPCPSPSLPSPSLPSPPLPFPPLPFPSLPFPSLPSPSLPSPALHCPAFPCPAPHLPCPAQPCPSPLVSSPLFFPADFHAWAVHGQTPTPTPFSHSPLLPHSLSPSHPLTPCIPITSPLLTLTDFHAWAVQGESRPVVVVASAARGKASQVLQEARGGAAGAVAAGAVAAGAVAAGAVAAGVVDVEDAITLMVQWQNKDGSCGTAVYTASWIAPPSDCHTQQYFHYMGHQGEVRVDQAHRGFTMSTDAAGFATLNPLYMKYTPDATGRFAGQLGYGYRSIAEFVTAAQCINSKKMTVADVESNGMIATIRSPACLLTTAILEGGRRSLDLYGAPITIEYDKEGRPKVHSEYGVSFFHIKTLRHRVAKKTSEPSHCSHSCAGSSTAVAPLTTSHKGFRGGSHHPS